MLAPFLAPTFLRGWGLRRRRVLRAVAPVDECRAQGSGQPLINRCVCDAEHRHHPPPPGRPAAPALCPATPLE